jgi:hypothetical protein
MWLTKHLCDALLRVIEPNGNINTLPCHKCILSTVPCFKTLALGTSSFKESGMTEPYDMSDFPGGFDMLSSMMEYVYGYVQSPLLAPKHHNHPDDVLKAVLYLGLDQKAIFDDPFTTRLARWETSEFNFDPEQGIPWIFTFFDTADRFPELIAVQKKITEAVRDGDACLDVKCKSFMLEFLLKHYSESCEETRVMILQMLEAFNAYEGLSKLLLKTRASVETYALELNLVMGESLGNTAHAQFVGRRSCQLVTTCGPVGISGDSPTPPPEATVSSSAASSSSAPPPQAAAQEAPSLAEVDSWWAKNFPAKELDPPPPQSSAMDLVDDMLEGMLDRYPGSRERFGIPAPSAASSSNDKKRKQDVVRSLDFDSSSRGKASRWRNPETGEIPWYNPETGSTHSDTDESDEDYIPPAPKKPRRGSDDADKHKKASVPHKK